MKVVVENVPPGYRMTELGPLPEEWEVVRLEEVFSVVPKKKRERIVEDNTAYRLLTVRLYAKGVILREVKEGKDIGTKKLYEVKEGDFVFSKIDARNGAWGFVSKDLSGALVSGDFPILSLNREIADEDFITFSLSRPSIWKVLRNIAVGTTNRRRVQPKEFLKVLSIPLPPLPEQKAIAYVLRAVQEAREKTEEVIKALKELKKSLMKHLFTYGPVPLGEVDKVSLKETEVGDIPEHWEVVRLGEVGKVVTGKTPSTGEPKYWNGTVPFITPVDLQGGEIYTTARTITQEGLTQTKTVPQGAVLVSCIGYIGKVGIVGTRVAATNQQINAVIPYTSVLNNVFLLYVLQKEEVQKIMDQMTRKTTVPILNKSNFSKTPIPLPPLHEQEQIAHILRSVDDKIETERKRAEALDTLFKTLLHDLLTARRRLPKDFVKKFE